MGRGPLRTSAQRKLGVLGHRVALIQNDQLELVGEDGAGGGKVLDLVAHNGDAAVVCVGMGEQVQVWCESGGRVQAKLWVLLHTTAMPLSSVCRQRCGGEWPVGGLISETAAAPATRTPAPVLCTTLAGRTQGV